MRQIILRLLSPTPKFFKKIRYIGFALVAFSAAILTKIVYMPWQIFELSGHLLTAGLVAIALSQASIKRDKV